MTVEQTRGWFQTHGIEISVESDTERLDAFLMHLSNNPQLSYQELYAWLASLRIPSSQNQTVESYEKMYGLEPPGSNEILEPRWTMANLSLSLEHEATCLPAVAGDSPALTEAEKHIVRVLSSMQSETMPLVIFHNTLYIPQVEEAPGYVNFFYDFAVANMYVGAAKSATIFLRLVERLLTVFGCAPFGYACLLSDWGFALQKADEDNAAVATYANSLGHFNFGEADPENAPEAAAAAHFWLRCGSASLALASFAEAQQCFSYAERFFNHPTLAGNREFDLGRGQLALFRASAQLQTGDAESAVSSYRVAEGLMEECLKPWRVVCAADYVTLLREYSEASFMAGDLFGANELAEKAVSFLAAPDMAQRYDLQVERARVEALLGLHDVRMRPSPTYHGALNHFARADELYAKLDYAARPTLQLEVGILHVNWATTLGLEKQFELALERFATAFRYIDSNSDADNPATALQLGHLCANRATVLRRVGRAADAVESCEEARRYYDLVAAQDSSMAAEAFAKLHCILANAYHDIGREDEACEAVVKSLSAFGSPELMHRRDLDMDRCRSYSAGARLLGKGLDSEWATHASRMMSVCLELRQTFTPEGYAMLYLFYAFHFKWIQYAFRESPKDMPLVLCAINGRRLSRQMLDEEEGYNVAVGDPAITRLLHLRRKLAMGRETFSETFADMKEAMNDALRSEVLRYFSGEKRPADAPPYEEAQEKYGQLRGMRQASHADVRDYVELRSRLSESAGGSTVLDPFATFDVGALAARLSPHEALVCLLDLRLEESEDVAALDEQYAWFLLPNREVRFVKLSVALGDLVDFSSAPGAGRGRGVLRRGPRRAARGDGPALPSWGKAARRCASELWGPIASELPETVSHVAVVTHGRFHVLPLELGKPDRLTCSHYINLIFFAQPSPAGQPPPSSAHQILLNRDPGLAFANREADPLLTEVWAASSSPVDLRVAEALDGISPAMPVQYLHVAGHGNRSPDRHKHRNVAEVQYDRKSSLTEQMVFTKLPPAEIVWLSSCVVGLTEEDMEGDPVGMIVPFLMRGSRFVVASLTEVPDLWMPLLVSLTEWFRMVERLPLPDALNRAKSALKAWVHEPDLAEFYRIYSDWLRATWRLWLAAEWGTGGPEPWASATPDEFRYNFHKRLLAEAVPDMGIELPETTLSQLNSSDGLMNAARIELLLDALVQASLVPPDDVRDTLTYAVRSFSGLHS